MAGRTYGEGSEIAQPGPHSPDQRSAHPIDRIEQCDKTIEEFAKHGCHGGRSFILRMVWNWRLIETARN